MRKIAIALALGAASTMIAAPALAGEAEPDVRSVRVKVTDEDFANAESIARLKKSIRRAAYKVCATADNSFAPPSREELQCVAKAIDGANQRLAEVQARHAIAYGG